jgi:hypothetical protein
MQQAAPDRPRLSEKDGRLIIHIPMQFRRRGGRKEIVLPAGSGQRKRGESPICKPLAIAIARAHRWQELLSRRRFKSISELAEAVGTDRGYVRRLLNLTLLAPDIIDAILAGNEPSGLSLQRLTRGLPVRWDEQRRVAASFSESNSGQRDSF